MKPRWLNLKSSLYRSRKWGSERRKGLSWAPGNYRQARAPAKLILVQRESRDCKANTPALQPLPTSPRIVVVGCAASHRLFQITLTTNLMEQKTSVASQLFHSSVPILQSDLSTMSWSHYRPVTMLTGEKNKQTLFPLLTINLGPSLTSVYSLLQKCARNSEHLQ